MKRLLPFVLVGLCGIALGAAAPKLNTFPYVSDALNAPCGKTLLEWNLMAGRIEAEPVPVRSATTQRDEYEIFRLEGVAQPKGVILRVYVRQRDPKIKPENLPIGPVRQVVQKRFNIGYTQKHCYILTYLDDRLTNISGNGSSHPVSPDATREEQLAALANIMSHAEPPAP